MTTEKQIAANRENAKKSTGPRSLDGKCKSRRNAVRHGLTAETVIDVLEDRGDYEALAAAINADYRPATNFEMQLISRLTSLLWRLRRATAIESGLLALEVDVRPSKSTCSNERFSVFCKLASSPARPIDCEVRGQDQETSEGCLSVGTRSSIGAAEKTGVARSFLRLTTREGSNFERLHRYEASLWRQTMQIILLLNSTSRCGEGSRARGPNSLRLASLRSKCKRSLWPPFSF